MGLTHIAFVTFGPVLQPQNSKPQFRFLVTPTLTTFYTTVLIPGFITLPGFVVGTEANLVRKKNYSTSMES